MVTGCLADIFNVIGSDGLLGIGNPRIFRDDRTIKIFLEGRNTRVDPEKGWVVDWDKIC